ncbi:hypothetical protein KXD93_09950 [Mucilaginibacter sp. BJC16-A38]|uniref:hypothetical protein n=1 Tax=Mucilaginibacter phenanthrenivorans TaxID=1234842 RepID=UPI002157B397|nr:hypothetical protein [Mucilaginibacter phenanthrenivorans]MCR8557966.1 hypothetical protein [Mucilaginibacter phenanthrenivorans]
MKNVINTLLLTCFAVFFIACKKPQEIPHYTVSKIFKTDTATTVNVHIANRMTRQQLVLIAGKVKKDSAQIQNLRISFLLPGNSETSAGDNSYYASAKFIDANKVASYDTLKDDDGNVLRLKVFGLSQGQAKHLLSLQPKEIANKNVMGRFIDDYNHTVIIPFDDPLDEKKEVYIIELDSAAKAVSKTIPVKVKDAGIEKWLVTQHGDYMTLKDSVLTQYGADGLGLPFNSIKSGI